MEEPCSGWNPETGLCGDWASFPVAVQTYALNFAKTILWAATGRRFGLCSVTTRPCFRRRTPLYTEYRSTMYWGLANQGTASFAAFYDDLVCACGSSCGCSNTRLPLAGPVNSITSVQVDADTIAASDYRLDGNVLVREDGTSWPTSQNLDLPVGEVGTFAVNYVIGEPVPDLLDEAAGVYACEVAKSRVGRTCSLPRRVRTITRQGVTIEMTETTDYLEKGLTGVSEVDEVIRAYNPYGHRDRPRVRSLDTPHLR
jgi:hypothetical protein